MSLYMPPRPFPSEYFRLLHLIRFTSSYFGLHRFKYKFWLLLVPQCTASGSLLLWNLFTELNNCLHLGLNPVYLSTLCPFSCNQQDFSCPSSSIVPCFRDKIFIFGKFLNQDRFSRLWFLFLQYPSWSSRYSVTVLSVPATENTYICIRTQDCYSGIVLRFCNLIL